MMTTTWWSSSEGKGNGMVESWVSTWLGHRGSGEDDGLGGVNVGRVR